MAEAERFQLVFDKEFVRLQIELAEKHGHGKMAPCGPGASVIINHEFYSIKVDEDNSLTMYSFRGLPDPYHPVIDMEKKEVIGVFFPGQRHFRIYGGKNVLKGARMEFGRYLAFVPNWRVVHWAMIKNLGKPGSALFIPN